MLSLIFLQSSIRIFYLKKILSFAIAETLRNKLYNTTFFDISMYFAFSERNKQIMKWEES